MAPRLGKPSGGGGRGLSWSDERPSEYVLARDCPAGALKRISEVDEELVKPATSTSSFDGGSASGSLGQSSEKRPLSNASAINLDNLLTVSIRLSSLSGGAHLEELGGEELFERGSLCDSSVPATCSSRKLRQ